MYAQPAYSQSSNAGGMWGGGGGGGGQAPAPAPPPHHQPQAAHQQYGDPMAQFGQVANLVNNPMFSSMAANYTDWDSRKQQVSYEYIKGSSMLSTHHHFAQLPQVEQNVSRLKYYFNVNNSYVLNKLKLLMFPWLHKVCVASSCFFHSSRPPSTLPNGVRSNGKDDRTAVGQASICRLGRTSTPLICIFQVWVS